MALLTPRVLLVLRNLTNDLGHCLYENGEMGSAACWELGADRLLSDIRLARKFVE